LYGRRILENQDFRKTSSIYKKFRQSKSSALIGVSWIIGLGGSSFILIAERYLEKYDKRLLEAIHPNIGVNG
jgi:hypothetical protein